MEVFNKLRSAVNSALPGNPLSKDFDVHVHIGSAGTGHLWKIFTAVKKTTKEEAAVFLFEKKQIEKYSRRDRDLIIQSLKKGVSQLTRLRHPKVLSVLHPLEESRENLAFATEPVFSCLSNVLGKHDNMPSTRSKEFDEYQLFEVEIKHGLLQITEGVEFLHKDVKMMHNNICPENIIINKNGSWKLFGFDCCVANVNTQSQETLYSCIEWDPEIPPVCQPNLDYMAPEYSLTMSCSDASDMFSIGVLLHTIFNNGKPVYECHSQISQFKKFADELRKFRSSLLGNVPEDLHQYVKLLLNTEPSVRPSPEQLMKIPFFEDVGSMTLQFMDTLFQRDNLQKSQFFKGLPKILTNLPKRVNLQRILPSLVKECVNNDMVPFVLPSLILMAEQCTEKEYAAHILPELKPLFKVKEPVQVTMIFLQNMNLLLKKTPQGDIRNHVLPMIHQALESDNAMIQEMCIEIVPTFADLIEFSTLKTSIIPRLKKICITTGSLKVRIHCLMCLGKLLEYMDKWTVLDDVLPLLPQITSREPAVLMSILGIYQVTMTHAQLGITKDILATKVLPFIIPLSMDSNLNLTQFNAYMTTIKEMINKMETDHRSKLEQIDKMKQEQKTLEITKISAQTEKQLIGNVDQQPQTMMDKVLSGFGSTNIFSSFGKSIKDKSDKSSTQTGAGDTSSSTSSSSTTQETGSAKTLSLEEKQRLAQQQEQQRIFKAQKPLNTSSGTPKKSTANATNPMNSSTVSRPSSQVKDLTSTLASANLSQMSASNASSKATPNYSINSMNSVGGRGMNSNMSGGLSLGQNSMMMPSNPSGGGSTGFSTMGQSSFSQQPKSQQLDLSAFDSLLPGSSQSNQSKMSLNTMSTLNTQKPGNTGMPMGQFNMAGPGMGGTAGMGQSPGMMSSPGMTGMMRPMGQQGMMGGQTNFGMQAGNQFGNQGFMQGNMGMQPGFANQPMGGQNFLQQQPMGMNNFGSTQNTTNTSSANSNDLADIFG